MPKNEKISVQGIEVGVSTKNLGDYINLTDIARWKNSVAPSDVVKNWMRTIDTVDFIGLWETLNNPDFNSVEFDLIKSNYGRNAFTLSPSQWVEKTNAIGIVAGRGKYSAGTFAHSDIALEFLSWISTEFKLYFIYEFKRLKEDESKRLSLEWNLQRTLAKINYKIHTSAVKEKLVPQAITKEQANFFYADEADLLNVALFGKTAKEWREENPDLKGNMRDYATLEQLVVLSNMESINALLIRQELSQSQRLIQLNATAITQMQALTNNKQIKLLG